MDFTSGLLVFGVANALALGDVGFGRGRDLGLGLEGGAGAGAADSESTSMSSALALGVVGTPASSAVASDFLLVLGFFVARCPLLD